MSNDKKNELFIYTITWRNLENRLSESDTRRDSIYKKFKNRQKVIYSNGSQLSWQGLDWKEALKNLSGVMEIFSILIQMMVM